MGRGTSQITASSSASLRTSAADASQQRSLDFLVQASKYSELVASEFQSLQARVAAGEAEAFREPSPTLKESFGACVGVQAQWVRDLKKSQTDAVDYYVGAGWRSLNAPLRHGYNLTPEAADHHQRLLELFEQAPPLAEALLVSRAVDKSEAPDFAFTASDIDQIYQDDFIKDPGYLSTGANCLRLGPTAEQVSLLVEVPAGSKALLVPAFRSWDADQEVLLAPDTQLEVQASCEHDNGGLSVFARLWP